MQNTDRGCRIHSIDFYLELRVFGAVPIRKKDEILDEGRDSLYFQVFPWHFYFMREHSLVELTEHDDSAADIVSHNIHICTATFIVHNVYRYNEWTPPRNSGGIP